MATSKRVYVDSSCYIAVLLGEKRASSVEEKFKNKQLCTSSLLILETERNLIRYSRQGLISSLQLGKHLARLKEDTAYFIFKDLNLDLCLTGFYPPVKTPRSADMVHLRTAHWFKMQEEGLESFLTLDKTLMEAAREMGFFVEE